MARILVVEDDRSVALFVQRMLERSEHSVQVARSGEDGLRWAQEECFDVVLTDLIMEGVSGLDLISQLKSTQPQIPIILMTAFGSTDVAIKATRMGAFDYLTKPFKMDDLNTMVGLALASRPSSDEEFTGEQETTPESQIVGKSPAMQEVCKDIGRLATSDITVLIRGETGTGKELVANALHDYSDRCKGPFIPINCMAIPDTLLESELFGYERVAFTGANTQTVGKFEQANRGTIFLDEIGDISLQTQGKLLRVLQEKHINRLGGRDNIQVDVRIIAATNRDLQQAIEQRLFREDLYYRLSGSVMFLPPLRERTDDIPELVRHFLLRFNQQTSTRKKKITLGALHLLEEQIWPGNIRELENVVYRALVMARGPVVTRELVRTALDQSILIKKTEVPNLKECVHRVLDRAEFEQRNTAYDEILELMERELFSQAIERAQGNQTKVAEWLGVSRPTIRQKLLQYRLS